jgi:FMN phosphatase YigB (HAD superfamily)
VAGRGVDIRAITFDFGNTLVPVDAASLRRVVEATARAAAGRLGTFEAAAFLEIWAEERERQFREDVPQFREVDLAIRAVRVLARLRGTTPPAVDERWDQELAAGRSSSDEIDWLVDVYSRSFVDALPPPPDVLATLERLSPYRRLAILSNWPLAATVDRYAEAAGWSRHLSAIIVSQRVGTIKPQPAIFEAARVALGELPPASILHVGDDWAADVAGAIRAGFRAAYVMRRPADSPLPSSVPDDSVVPEFEIESVSELVGLLPRVERSQPRT